MNKSIKVFILSMVVFYLLIVFVTLHINFILWTENTRLMYALLAPPLSGLITMEYNYCNKKS